MHGVCGARDLVEAMQVAMCMVFLVLILSQVHCCSAVTRADLEPTACIMIRAM